MRLTTSSAVRGGSGKSCQHVTPSIKRLEPPAPSIKRVVPPETLDECRESAAAYDLRHSVRLIPLYIGVYFVAVVLGWGLTAVVIAAWFRP